MDGIGRLFTQFCKFGLVGAICFCIDYGLMILLTEFGGFLYYEASGMSFVVSVALNYVLSMRFVFKGKDDMSKWQEILIFVLLSIVGLALNQMIMWIAVELFRVFYALAKIFSTMLVTVYNFLSRKLFLEA